MGTIVVGGILLAAVIAVITGIVRKKRSGGKCAGCDCGCSSGQNGQCPYSGSAR